MSEVLSEKDVKRFWKYVNISAPNVCWEWSGCRTGYGYGQLRVNKKSIYAHRISFELANGHIDKNKCILHSCDNPPCVNPNHLSSGTKSDNSFDASRKKRHPMSKKTHCPAGHEYSEKNLVKSAKARVCRECALKRQKIYYKKRRSK